MHEEQNIINYDDFVVCIKCNKVLLKGNQKKHCLCGVNGNYVDFNTYAKSKEKPGWVVAAVVLGLCTGAGFFIFSPLFGYLAYKSKVVKPREEAILHCRQGAHRVLYKTAKGQVEEGKNLLSRAFDNFNAGNYQEALADFKIAYELGQDSQDLYKAIGICNLNLNNYQEALKWFSIVNPDQEVDQMKARCYIESQDASPEALDFLYGMAKTFPQKIGKDSLVYLVQVYKNTGLKDEKSIEIYKSYLTKISSDPQIKAKLIEALFSEKKYQECIDYGKTTLAEIDEGEEKNTIVQFYSWALAELRDLTHEAAQVYMERLKREPADLKIRLRYGEYLIKEKRLDECILLYKEGLKIFPNNLDLKYRLGIVYHVSSMYHEAIGELQTIARTEGFEKVIPKEQLYFALGRAFLKANLFDLAYKHFSSLELTYEICDMLYELGISWEKAGEVANAKKCFETIYGFDINYRDVAKRILDNKYKLTT